LSGLGLEKSEGVALVDKFEESLTEKAGAKMNVGWMKV
jgi:hypothetical protein